MGSMDPVQKGIHVLSFPIYIIPHQMQSFLHLFTATCWELFFITFSLLTILLLLATSGTTALQKSGMGTINPTHLEI